MSKKKIVINMAVLFVMALLFCWMVYCAKTDGNWFTFKKEPYVNKCEDLLLTNVREEYTYRSDGETILGLKLGFLGIPNEGCTFEIMKSDLFLFSYMEGSNVDSESKVLYNGDKSGVTELEDRYIVTVSGTRSDQFIGLYFKIYNNIPNSVNACIYKNLEDFKISQDFQYSVSVNPVEFSDYINDGTEKFEDMGYMGLYRYETNAGKYVMLSDYIEANLSDR